MTMQLTGKDQSVYKLTPEEQADIADAQIARDDFATDEQVRAIWVKHGL